MIWRDYMYEKTKVILPKWCWDNANNKTELKQNIIYYMQRYEGYKVIEVGKYYAICEIERV